MNQRVFYSVFGNSVRRIVISSSLPDKIPLLSHLVLDFGTFLITDSVSLLVINLFRLSFLIQSWKVICLQRFIHFFQIVQFVGIYNMCIIFSNGFFFISVISVVISPLKLIFFEFSLFFFSISLAKGLSILLIFKKRSFWDEACVGRPPGSCGDSTRRLLKDALLATWLSGQAI